MALLDSTPRFQPDIANRPAKRSDATTPSGRRRPLSCRVVVWPRRQNECPVRARPAVRPRRRLRVNGRTPTGTPPPPQARPTHPYQPAMGHHSRQTSTFVSNVPQRETRLIVGQLTLKAFTEGESLQPRDRQDSVRISRWADRTRNDAGGPRTRYLGRGDEEHQLSVETLRAQPRARCEGAATSPTVLRLCMRAVAALLAAAAAVIGTSASVHAVAHGAAVPDGEFPFAVKLNDYGIPVAGGGRRDSSCSGGLISPHWVLTAGHCF